MKFFIILILYPISIIAQNDRILTSDFYERVLYNDNYYFTQKDTVFSIKLSKDFITIQKFDVNQNKMVKKESFTPLNKNEKLESVLEINNKYFLFYSYWDKKNKLEQLFSIEIDFNNFKLNPKKKIVQSEKKIIGELVYTAYYKFETKNKYKFSLSKNKKNLLIRYQIRPSKLEKYDRSYNAKFALLKFKDNLNFEEKIYEMPSPNILSNYYDFLLTDSNEVYILSDVYDNEEMYHYVGNDKNYHIEILKIINEDIRSIKISEKSFYIKNIKLIEGLNNVIVAGYYLEKGFLSNVDGIFYCKIKDEKVKNINYIPIPLEIINLYENEKKQSKNIRLQKKSNLDFENLVLNSLEIDSIGNLIVIGEQYREKESLVNYGNMSSYGKLFKYFYSDILIVKLSSDGDLFWMKKIPKNQYDDLYQDLMFYKKKNTAENLSFKYFTKNNKICFVYWDLTNNLNISSNEKPLKYIGIDWAKLFLYEIDYFTGEVEKKIVFNPLKYMSDRGNARLHNFSMPLNEIVYTKKKSFF